MVALAIPLTILVTPSYEIRSTKITLEITTEILEGKENIGENIVKMAK